MFKFIKLIVMLFMTILFIVGCDKESNKSGDSTVPLITIDGELFITIEINSLYIDEGATAHDNVDGNIKVVISGHVDSTKLGTYIITYTATDKAGNQSVRTRTVEVEENKITLDTTPPVISIQ